MTYHSIPQAGTEYLDRAEEWARQLTRRTGKPREQACAAVAASTHIPPGVIENLIRGRAKQIAASFYERLRTALERELAAEVTRLEHELQLCRAAGLDPREHDFAAAEAALLQARKALGR